MEGPKIKIDYEKGDDTPIKLPSNETESVGTDSEIIRLSNLLAETMDEMLQIDNHESNEYIKLKARYNELNNRIAEHTNSLEADETEEEKKTA